MPEIQKMLVPGATLVIDGKSWTLRSRRHLTPFPEDDLIHMDEIGSGRPFGILASGIAYQIAAGRARISPPLQPIRTPVHADGPAAATVLSQI